jgi:hypothetical protein
LTVTNTRAESFAACRRYLQTTTVVKTLQLRTPQAEFGGQQAIEPHGAGQRHFEPDAQWRKGVAGRHQRAPHLYDGARLEPFGVASDVS